RRGVEYAGPVGDDRGWKYLRFPDYLDLAKPRGFTMLVRIEPHRIDDGRLINAIHQPIQCYLNIWRFCNLRKKLFLPLLAAFPTLPFHEQLTVNALTLRKRQGLSFQIDKSTCFIVCADNQTGSQVGLLVVGNKQWTELAVLLLGPREFNPMEDANIHLAIGQHLTEVTRVHRRQFRVPADLGFP